ncbi:MAG: aminoacetone oxidase family FAD-binding enzyme [Magnetococcales bacterium]|nr:NAD(P)/FAD-dependent oxidoreductase [Magnetococcales bacterium]NGZ25249.1 aminoacetone oxidase family FAD-binding enzyme [Magnetococcales bacterium]
MIAAQRGRSVVVVDHARQLGEKIRISGGGRCNFTNLNSGANHYLSNNPRFTISALARFTPHHFMDLLSRHGIQYLEKGQGQLFCQGSAHQVVDMLIQECRQANVQLHPSSKIESVRRQGDYFLVKGDGFFWQCQSLVVATGGPSLPKLGASDYGMALARSFGLQVVPPRPGLVPLTFNDWSTSRFASLSGVSLQAAVSLGSHTYQDGLLFTHKGLSGPAILQISSHWHPGSPIQVNLLPGVELLFHLKEARRNNRGLLPTLSSHLPRRLVDILCQGQVPRLADMNDERLLALVQSIQQATFTPSGQQGYGKAEVTVGGVDTSQLSSKTMAVLTIPNLYFVGEVVDVTGELGGYNLQWAWSSGYAAGCHA